MENSSEKRFLIDTSAFISLERIGLLSKVINLFGVITTSSVIRELEDFAVHSDKYGLIARKVLGFRDDILIIDPNAKEKVPYLQDTDNELFSAAKQAGIPLVSDDHKLVHHTRDKIDSYFSTFFLILFVSAEIISKNEALGMLEKMRDIRNWKSNIIYLTTKEAIAKF